MQLPHFDAQATAAGDISAGLDEGIYIAQLRAQFNTPGILYATAAVEPADLDDYFVLGPEAFMTFEVTADSMPVWVRSQVVARSVALAKL